MLDGLNQTKSDLGFLNLGFNIDLLRIRRSLSVYLQKNNDYINLIIL